MVQCINSACLKAIGEEDSFCSYCGEDNRPSFGRKPALDHDHARLKDGFFCTVCGIRMREEPTGRRPLAGMLMLIGSAFFWAVLLWLLIVFPFDDAIVFVILAGCIAMYLSVTGIGLVRKKKAFRLKLRK